MRLTIVIDLGNDAMRSPTDVEDAVATAIRNESDTAPLSVGEEGPITDRNGNTVGRWEVTE